MQLTQCLNDKHWIAPAVVRDTAFIPFHPTFKEILGGLWSETSIAQSAGENGEAVLEVVVAPKFGN